MNQRLHATERPMTYDIMATLWTRWRKTTDIDTWHFAKHIPDLDTITLGNAEFTFMQMNVTAGIKPDDILLTRKTWLNTADAIAVSMRNALIKGNILLVRDIEPVERPTAPYHWDDVYKWEGFPVRIQARPMPGFLHYHFTFYLGVQV